MRGFLLIEGTRLEFCWHGPKAHAAPTLVLLHEGLGCVELWRQFPSRLSEVTGCGALVFSRAGYGQSDPVPIPRPLTYMHTEALHVLPKVLDAAEIERAILVGHSDGGSIALIYGGGMSDLRLGGMVCLAAHVFNERICVERIREARQHFESGDLRAKLARYHGANVDCAFWGWNRAWLAPGFLAWNIEEYLPGIQVPVLAMQGADDEYGTSRQLDAIREKVGGAVESAQLGRCGHSIHLEQPEIACEKIARFVDRVL